MGPLPSGPISPATTRLWRYRCAPTAGPPRSRPPSPLAATAVHAQPDHPDGCADAAAITPGEPPVFSAIDGADDQDWFAFEAQAGHLDSASLDGLDGHAPGIALFSPDCAEPVAVPALGSPVQTFLARADGPHRIRVALESPTCAGVGATVLAPDAQRPAAAIWTGPDVGPCESPSRAESIFYVPSTEPGDHFIVVRRDAGPAAAPYLLSIEPTGCLADFDHSGAVNSADVSAFLGTWLAAVALPHPDYLAADFSGDGATRSSDIAAFLQSWLGVLTDGGNC